MLSYSIVGSADVVRQGLQKVVAQTAADEVIVASQIFDHAARLRSYEIAIRAAALTQATSAGAARENAGANAGI
jgi:alkanesulfonate monooxygenase SsuD/methylene tetrahydromethanopterin reductase-like flavin-dependent oxidoreductase (luciferase family)